MFKAPLYSIINTLVLVISLCIAVYLSYYLTQHKNDKRKTKEVIEKLADKIQIMLVNLLNETDNPKNFTRLQRDINNRIAYLANVKERFDIIEDVNYIRNEYNNYKEIFANHPHDINDNKLQFS